MDSGGRRYKLEITNEGLAAAMHVNLSGPATEPGTGVVIRSELERLLPWPELAPGDSFTTLAPLDMSTELPVDLVITWIDPGGEQRSRTGRLDWPA